MAMNAHFLDGPASDMNVPVTRTPLLLRIAIDEAGDIRVLDRPTDIRFTGDNCYVYERVGMTGSIAQYRGLKTQPGEFDFRTNENWLAWATRHTEAQKAGNGPGRRAS
jgi:hypothetical protein